MSPQTFAQKYQEINDALWSVIQSAGYSVDYVRKRRFPQLLKAVIPSASAQERRELASTLEKAFTDRTPDRAHHYPGMIPALQSLHEAGYVLHILTNGVTESQSRKVAALGLTSMFSTLTTSDEAQAYKPDRAIFRYAMRRALCAPEQSVMIGDSITHNWESEKNYEQTFAGLNMLNLGFAGDRTQNVLWRIQHGALDNIEPKLVTLMIGTNHMHNPKKGYSPDSSEDIFTGIQEIIKEIRTRLPNSKIIVFSVFPRRAPENERVKALNQLIPQIADNEMIFHRDISKIFLDSKGSINKTLYSRDGLHLNSKGYDSWAKALKSIIEEYSSKNQ